MTQDPIMVSDTGPERELPPAGIVNAVCCHAVDIGYQDTGKYGVKQQIMLGFELAHVIKWEGEYQGKRFHITPFAFNATLNDSNLLKCLVGWYGRDLTPEERKGLDLTTLVGKGVTVTIAHKESGGKTYANIVAYAPPMDGVETMIIESKDIPDWVKEKQLAGTTPGFTKPSMGGGEEAPIPFMRRGDM